jgi:hypothetical protein
VGANDPMPCCGGPKQPCGCCCGQEDKTCACGDVWHVIEGGDIRALLRRAHAGEDPELLYIEYVNAEKGD